MNTTDRHFWSSTYVKQQGRESSLNTSPRKYFYLVNLAICFALSSFLLPCPSDAVRDSGARSTSDLLWDCWEEISVVEHSLIVEKQVLPSAILFLSETIPTSSQSILFSGKPLRCPHSSWEPPNSMLKNLRSSACQRGASSGFGPYLYCAVHSQEERTCLWDTGEWPED